MIRLVNKLPEDMIFSVQEFIGKEKKIYFNKFVNEYRFKLNVKNDKYKCVYNLYDDVSIIYNKKTNGSVLEVGNIEYCKGIKSSKYRITHIVYEHYNKLYVHTECQKRFEYYDPYDSDRAFEDVPYYLIKKCYTNDSKI
jgi:hypothetical protein